MEEDSWVLGGAEKIEVGRIKCNGECEDDVLASGVDFVTGDLID